MKLQYALYGKCIERTLISVHILHALASRECSPIRVTQKSIPYRNGTAAIENGYANTNGHYVENGNGVHLQNGHSHNAEHSDDEYIDTVEVNILFREEINDKITESIFYVLFYLIKFCVHYNKYFYSCLMMIV